jgi:hypothetical protein
MPRMSVTEAADKVATNPVLTALARVAMFITPILVTISLFVITQYLNGQAAAMSAMSSRISVTETLGTALDKRTTVLEDSIVRGRQDRLEFQERTEALLEKLAEQMTADRIVAAQVKTDVSYLRTFIEELKRERRALE